GRAHDRRRALTDDRHLVRAGDVFVIRPGGDVERAARRDGVHRRLDRALRQARRVGRAGIGIAAVGAHVAVARAVGLEVVRRGDAGDGDREGVDVAVEAGPARAGLEVGAAEAAGAQARV